MSVNSADAAAGPSPRPSEAEVVAARTGLHAVAEQVLAGPQHRTSGTIRLTVRDGGFATVARPAAGLDALLVTPEGVRAEPGDLASWPGTIRELAAALGIEPGAPQGVYPATGAPGPDDPLTLPAAGVAVVLGALTEGDHALGAFLAQVAPGREDDAVLWPEHFDLGLTLDEVNYGISPGDAGHPWPYAYVGPWERRDGDFWNETFGAARDLGALGGLNGLIDFLVEGRERARRDPVHSAT
jgi:hypothetical protein